MKNHRIIAAALLTLISLFSLCAWMTRAESKPRTTTQVTNDAAQPLDDRMAASPIGAETLQNAAKPQPISDATQGPPKVTLLNGAGTTNALQSSPKAGTANAQAGSSEKKIDNREQILEAEQRLASLGYWTGPVDGVMDEVSRQALVAFQKVEGRKRTGVLTVGDLQALRTAVRPSPLYGGGEHIEVDLSRQVLFVVDGNGTVEKVLAISSGSGNSYVSEGRKCRAVTPVGRFAVYNKITGYRKAPLGMIYYPSYFDGGFAIHGSASVPAFPASHGCVRVPMFAAKQLSEMTPLGMVIIVHDGKALDSKTTVPAA